MENDQKICGQYFQTDIHKLEGEEILLTGKWITHSKYGEQFLFDALEVKQDGMLFFLTKVVKGFPKKTAKEILLRYSDEELIDILNNNPQVLLNFKGIKEKKLKTIMESWQGFKHLKELGVFLSPYGVGNNLLNKIYETFADVPNIIEKIKENPYILTKIKGVGFKRADEIALALGIDTKSKFRIESAINFLIKEYCDNKGNSSIENTELFKMLDEALKFESDDEIISLYQDSISSLIKNGELFNTTSDRYSLKMLYYAEKTILEFFKRREKLSHNKTRKIVSNLTEYIKDLEKTLGFSLSQEQKKALKLINKGANTILLIGYAGTGKSTSSRAILDLLHQRYEYDEIICIALSGIATQRIYETTGYNGSTIQSLIISSKEYDKLPYKVILLDEASMVNSMLFYQIISKISDDSVFIIVGDDGQLPAIGAGNILSDAIKYELAPISKLTKIYRQNEKQAIAVIANDIRQAKVPNYKDEFDDFMFVDISINSYYVVKSILNYTEFKDIRANNSEKILTTIINISAEYIVKVDSYIKQKQIDKALRLFQVITPMKAGILGVENLNIHLQKIFNPRTKYFEGKTYHFKIGDKVIHTKNENMKIQTMEEYKQKSDNKIQKRVFNGMLGLIISISFDDEVLVVLYPNDDMVVFYSFKIVDNLLALAYSLTIHKTQGMEYDTALIPMSFSHYIMHNTKLLYTAITRAKNMCYIVGEEEAFVGACKRIETTKRESVINDLMGINFDEDDRNISKSES